VLAKIARRTLTTGTAVGVGEGVQVLSTANTMLGTWVGGVAAAVFGMVAVGGYTRLTRSGLSITEWKLQGVKLPSTDDEWEHAFALYKVRC
jgi:heme A synthase